MSELIRNGNEEAAAAFPRAPRATASRLAASTRAWLAVGAGLAVLGYAPLLRWAASSGAGVDVERVMFRPEASSPELLLAMTAWLVYRRWQTLCARARAGRSAPWLGLPLLVAAIGVAAWARYVSAPELGILSLFAGGLGAGALLGGLPLARALLVPALFLLLALPWPGALANAAIQRLQEITVVTTDAALGLMGIESMSFGDLIYTQNRVFHVIESCSGFRFQHTLMMASVLYLDLFYRSRAQAVVILLLTPLLAIVMNTLRVLTIIFNPSSDIATVHTLQGLVVIVLAVLLLHAFDHGVLARLLPTDPPRRRRRVRGPGSPLAARLAVLAGLAALALVPIVLTPWQPAARTPAPWLRLPEQVPGWRHENLRLDREFLGSVAYTQRIHRRYASPDGQVDVLVGLDDHLDPRRSAQSRKNALPGSGHRIVRRAPVEIPAPAAVTAEEIETSTLRERFLIHWWTVGSRGLLTESLRGLLHLDRGPLRDPSDYLVFRFTTPIRGGDVAAARARLQALEQELVPALEVTPAPAG